MGSILWGWTPTRKEIFDWKYWRFKFSVYVGWSTALNIVTKSGREFFDKTLNYKINSNFPEFLISTSIQVQSTDVLTGTPMYTSLSSSGF